MGDPVQFADGTAYCEHGREVLRFGFWWQHTDDKSVCEHSLEEYQERIKRFFELVKRNDKRYKKG